MPRPVCPRRSATKRAADCEMPKSENVSTTPPTLTASANTPYPEGSSSRTRKMVSAPVNRAPVSLIASPKAALRLIESAGSPPLFLALATSPPRGPGPARCRRRSRIRPGEGRRYARRGRAPPEGGRGSSLPPRARPRRCREARASGCWSRPGAHVSLVAEVGVAVGVDPDLHPAPGGIRPVAGVDGHPGPDPFHRGGPPELLVDLGTPGPL